MCGKQTHLHLNISRLADLGSALDKEQVLSVFRGGFVGFCDADESEVMQHVARKAGRSTARPWSGQRAAERPRRAAGEAHNFRSEAAERAFGTELRILAQHYAALAIEDQNGLWVVAPSAPLGRDGPQIHFLIAFPFDRSVIPRGWAFDRIGRQARPMALKHTNFPDGSICAFMADEGAWAPEDGMTALVDHYSVWAVKSLHRQHLGWWPGKQFGACALYRRMEFMPLEQCGCLSGKRYRDCHQGADLVVDEGSARREFRLMFKSDYHDRAMPSSILDAAKSGWKKMPQIKDVMKSAF